MLTLTDMFCGAGGSSTGAIAAPGVEVRVASNHWRLAIETHNTNHPDADHICADLSQTHPRYFPRTDILWASPECTNHSRAKGRPIESSQDALWGDALPDEAAERSRATMWDVVRFADHHAYRAAIVENVVEVTQWRPFASWLSAMHSLGYRHQLVSLNSMHAQRYGLPAPQSRDRFYAVFTRVEDPAPDLSDMQRPLAWCEGCGEVVRSRQWWKRDRGPDQVGRYRQQYLYRCPNVRCRHAIVEPAWLPAYTAIDWTIPGQRIGDRTKPLAEKTRARIAAGIARYWHPLGTLTTHDRFGLVVPAGGTWNDDARPTDDALRTLTTRDAYALVMRNNTGGAEMVTPAWEEMRTITTAGHQSILTPGDIAAARAQVDDVLFRMLEPSEAKRGMAFPHEYVILGTRREQVRMAGNAVTPPAARDLVTTVAATLNGAAA